MGFNNFSSSVKLNKIQTFNNVRTDTKYFNNVIQTTEYEDIDYSNTVEESNVDWSIDYTADKALKKIGQNTLFYGLSDAIKEGFSVKSSPVLVLVAMGAKFISTGEISWDPFIEGGSKKILTESITGATVTLRGKTIKTPGMKNVELNVVNRIFKSTGSQPIENIKDFENLIWKAFEGKSVNTTDLVAREYISNFAKSQITSLGTGTVVDYVASLGVNCIVGAMDGDGVSLEEAKLGTTFLKSTWKTVGSKAFETIGFAVLGPKGKIIGKTVGTVLGATMGDFVVSAFDNNENWCAIAGGATIAGAVGASAIFTTLIATGAITCSIPVAGWIVGGAMIVGALIGSGITWIIYKCSGG